MKQSKSNTYKKVAMRGSLILACGTFMLSTSSFGQTKMITYTFTERINQEQWLVDDLRTESKSKSLGRSPGPGIWVSGEIAISIPDTVEKAKIIESTIAVSESSHQRTSLFERPEYGRTWKWSIAHEISTLPKVTFTATIKYALWAKKLVEQNVILKDVNNNEVKSPIGPGIYQAQLSHGNLDYAVRIKFSDGYATILNRANRSERGVHLLIDDLSPNSQVLLRVDDTTSGK